MSRFPFFPLSSNRRDFLRTTLAAGAATLTGCVRAAEGTDPAFTLAPLPYAFDALEPVIDSKTMSIHYTKHNQGYVNKLNTAIAGEPSLAGKSIEELLTDLEAVPAAVRTAVRNNGGGSFNHALFWTVMRPPRENNKPEGALAEAIGSAFGSVEKFQEAFSTAAKTQFGSGWAWLVTGPGGLEVVATPNQDSPLTSGKTPLLGIDVWEHAYYLKYQNRRADYVDAWWKLVNWDEVARRHTEAG